MATYKEIHGTNIEVVSSDPSNPVEGQVWYNSTSNVVKGFVVDPGSWATGGSMNTARRSFSGAGTQTAAIGAGGYDGASRPAPEFGSTNATEQYNGTTWTTVNNLGFSVYNHAMAGTSSAALLFGGRNRSGSTDPTAATTATWNGTNWTNVNDMNTGRNSLGGFGTTNTACIGYGGYTGSPPDATVIVESWNGSNWTTVNDMGTRRFRSAGGAGSSTAGLAVAGNSEPQPTDNVETWNGTNWAETTDLPGQAFYNSTVGTQTSAVTFGGSAPQPFGEADTATWNGSNWTTVGSMNAGRQAGGQSGANNTSALACGGYSPPSITTATEEFSAGPVTKTFATS